MNSTGSVKVKARAEKCEFRMAHAAGVAEAQTKLKPSSWWTQHAQPDQRNSFAVALAERNAAREHKRHALTRRGTTR